MTTTDVSAEPEKTAKATSEPVPFIPIRYHRHKDGTVFPVEITANIFELQGRKTIIATTREITERKKIEEEHKQLELQRQQLQKTESLGRMAGAIAHHFNNHLGVVIGNLEMTIDNLPQDAEPFNSLSAAMQAASKAAEMSSLMLTYLGQSFDNHEPLDLSDVCRRSLPLLKAVMPGDVTMKTDLPSPGPIIMANAPQIQQVLSNLITNAWEAIGDGRGAIHLRVKTVSPTEITAAYRSPIDWQSLESAYVCLEVTDTGCGIEDTVVEKLFDPFFSTKFTGRGLGLAAVMGIVKAHGGVVTVESEPGRGSAFRVFFPMSREEVLGQPDKAAQPLAAEKGGGTVLLVEDEEMVREVAAAMLNRLGFSVLEAKDGVEAVEVFRQHQDEIRCVLSDLTMPRMNGWETLAALRKLAPDIPVILASGYDEAHVMAGDHAELPQVFLGKPYRLKGLSDAISHALNKK
jgi:signal transduction histidine kinase/CheY-like chemotaxis protein